MNKVYFFLKSLRLSLGLLITLLPLIGLTSIIPQKGKASPATIQAFQDTYPTTAQFATFCGIDHLYTSWWFLTLFSILFINMTIVTWLLYEKTKRKSQGLHRFSGETPEYFSCGSFANTTEACSDFEKGIRKSGYSVNKIGGEIYCRKGWMGIWGSTVLHIGLVIILAGAVISGLSRFNGYVEIGEGQSILENNDSYAEFNEGFLFPGHQGKTIQISLKNTVKKQIGNIGHLFSTVSIYDNNNEELTRTLRVNEPVTFNNFKLYQSRYSGPAILFSVMGPAGTNTGYINLQATGTMSASSLFTIPGTPLQASVEHTKDNKTVSLEVREQSKLLYQGPMQAKQTLDLGRWKIKLIDINRWVGFIVVYDWGVSFIFSGFWLSVLGVAIMAIFDPKEIWLKKLPNDNTAMVEIVGWGRWKNMFHEELDELIKGVKQWKT